jgi:hypothetical protein
MSAAPIAKFTRALLAAMSLVLVVPACGRKQPAAPAPAPETQSQPAAAPAPETQPQPAAAETPAAAQPLVGDVNEFMTGQLSIFIQQNGRLPKDFGEFSRARLDSVPRTPAGMKWAIDTVTREVKLVKQ